MAARNSNAAGPGRRSFLVVGLVVLLGALGTGLAAFALQASANTWSRRAFDQKQDVVAKVVMAEIAQYAISLNDLAAAVGAQSELYADEFAAITAPLSNLALPGATDISLVVPATAATAASVQALWRQRGATGLTLEAAAGAAADHYFPVLNRSLDGSTLTVGDDLAGSPEVVDALTVSRDRKLVAASHTFRPSGQGPMSFVMAAPVYATSPSSQTGLFRGWVTMSFRGGDFLGQSIGIIAGDQVGVRLTDTGGGRTVDVAAWHPDAAADTSMPAKTIEIPVQTGMWTLTLSATVKLLPPAQARLPEAAALVGGTITVLLAALTITVATARDRALREVARATAELRHDIERREAVEQQLRTREEELVGFAGVVAHDLRSPLANVMGYASLLASGAEDYLTEKQFGWLTRVQNGASRMKHLIDDLLAYATAENTTLRVTGIDLSDMVENIVMERLGEGLEPEPRIHRSALPYASGDPTLIRQVLDNLIGNAIKYTPHDRTPEVTVSARAEDDTLWRIEVADRGIGIPAAQREEIFNAFTRADGSETYPGTGLGLAIVQRIVERHGGTAGVDENPGGGSVFWFTLPRGDQAG